MKLNDIYGHTGRPEPGQVELIKRAIAEMLTMSDFQGVPLFAIPFGDLVYTFPPTPATAEGKHVDPGFLGWHPQAAEFLRSRGLIYAAGALPVTKVVNGMPIPASVILVTGRGNVGKTPFAHALASIVCEGDQDGFGLLRYGEPFAGYLKTERQAGHELAYLVATHRAVVIDSIKDLLTDMSGQAMESGLARRSISMLSRMAMVASEIGCSIVIPLNPSSSKETIGDLIAEIARSNVGMAAINGSGKWQLISREGEGRLRIEGNADLSFKDGLPSLTLRFSGAAHDSEDPVAAAISTFETRADAPIDGLLGAARRLANKQD